MNDCDDVDVNAAYYYEQAIKPWLERWSSEMRVEGRRHIAVRLRSEGRTFKEIGRVFGVSAERARTIYLHGLVKVEALARGDRTIECLSTRTRNCLRNIGLPATATREQVVERLGDLRMGANVGAGSIKNFGQMSLAEVERWLSRG